MKNHQKNTHPRRNAAAYKAYMVKFEWLAQEFIATVIFHFSQNCEDYTRRKEKIGSRFLENKKELYRDKNGNPHYSKRERNIANELIRTQKQNRHFQETIELLTKTF